MPFVVDASVTVVWAYGDEESPYAVAVLERVKTDRVFVPTIWPLEVANALLIGERRGRITPQATVAFLATLSNLGIVIDNRRQTWEPVLTYARTLGLTAYDASYLELAARLGLALATQDSRLRSAAAQLGVPIYDPDADAGSSNGQVPS